jgi:hypothetical protein
VKGLLFTTAVTPARPGRVRTFDTALLVVVRGVLKQVAINSGRSSSLYGLIKEVSEARGFFESNVMNIYTHFLLQPGRLDGSTEEEEP